jgi:ABC-2 type transport system permease protein
MPDNPMILNPTMYNSIAFQIHQVWALSIKNIRLYFRKGPVLMFGLLFPFFIALTWILGREISNERIFIGITTMAIFFTASAISPVILPWETREKGLERQITAPVSLPIILWGIILSSVLYSLIIGAIIVIGLSIGIGFLFISIGNLIMFILGCILIALVGSLIGVLVSAPPTDQLPDIMTLANLIKFPLIFISGVFIPLSQSSPTGQIVALCSPLTPFVEIVASCVGESTLLPIIANLGILLGWCVILYCGSIIAHSRTFSKRFSH